MKSTCAPTYSRLILVATLFGWSLAGTTRGATVTLTGRVTGPDGAIQGALVEYAFGNSSVSVNTMGEEGRYTITRTSDVPFVFRVRARKPHEFLPSSVATVTVQPGGTETLNFSLVKVNKPILLDVIKVGNEMATLTSASKVNFWGEVAGLMFVGQGMTPRALLYANNAVSAIDTLPGGSGNYAVDISLLGEVVGGSDRTGLTSAAFFFNGQVADIADQRESVALGISFLGEISGWFIDAMNRRRPGLYGSQAAAGQRWSDLGTLGGRTGEATSINTEGWIVGSSHTVNQGDGKPHAFIHLYGGMFDLGTLGGDTSAAARISDCGEVVGQSKNANGETRAFYWNLGNPRELVPPQGAQPPIVARDINYASQVVGYSKTADGQRAILWDPPSFAMFVEDLLPNDTGWTVESATGINDRGQIVGDGLVKNNRRAYLLSRPQIGNRPPRGQGQVNASVTNPGVAQTFDAGASSDEDGQIVDYHWDFGDGEIATGAVVLHAYTDVGTYTPILTVTDDRGDRSSTVLTSIHVRLSSGENSPPRVYAGAFAGVEAGQPFRRLVGYVNDDGLPSCQSPGDLLPGSDKDACPMTTLWNLVAGPAGVTIEDPLARETSVEITQNGIYLFRLTAFDGGLSTSANVVIVVSDMDGSIENTR